MSKKGLLLCMALAFFGTFAAKAQVDVTINPIGLLFGDLSLGADFVLSDDFSAEGSLGIGSGDDFGADFSTFNVTGFGKYYFSPDEAASKFYALAFLRYVNRSYEYVDDNTTYADYDQSRFGIGFGIGYKVVGNSGIVFDINIGAGRALVDNLSFKTDGEEFEIDWPEIMFAGKLGIGYRFGNN